MGRDTVQLKTAVSTITHEYLLEFTSKYGISEDLHPELPDRGDRIVDFPEGKMDLFNLISTPNPIVIKTGTRPRTAHEMPLLTVIASRQIDMDEPAATSESSGAPSTIERSPRDFSNENPSEQINEGNRAEDQGSETMAFVVPPAGPSSTMGAAPNIVEEEETAADAPLVSKRRRKRANEESNANAPRKETPTGTMNLDPISFAKPSSVSEQDISQSSKGATAAGGPEPDPTSPTMVVSPGSIYQPEWGVTNGYRLDTPSSCQELLRLRYKQEAKLLKKSVAQVARRDQRIQAMEGEKKNLETLLEAEADMRKAAEAKNAELVKEMENLRAQFTELQVSRDGLSHQVSTLQAQ
ncbi:hypothetical protein Tco_0223878, partial [Tanacetum coccineum]